MHSSSSSSSTGGGGLPRGRELSLGVEPKANAPMGAFQMLLLQGDECEERSESAVLSDMALVKSRDRVWVLHVSREAGTGGEGGTDIARHGCHITTGIAGCGVHIHRRAEARFWVSEEGRRGFFLIVLLGGSEGTQGALRVRA